MGNSVALDRSGWSDEALARAAAELETRSVLAGQQERRKSHIWAGAISGLSDEALRASSSSVRHMKSRDYGNGHKEVAIWTHEPDLQGRLDRFIDRDCGIPPPVQKGDGDREASQAAAARRARQKVRELCKTLGVNALWTLTYRENVTDRDLVLRHLDRFRRRVGELLGEWRYVAVLERQERGAWHIHAATHALPARIVRNGVTLKSWDVMRAIWRNVVGELGGNFDEAKRKARWGSKRPFRGAGAIASYIAGYVVKEMAESALNRQRYTRSHRIDVPPAYRAIFAADVPWRELIELAFAALGERITRTWFDPEKGCFFAASDDTG